MAAVPRADNFGWLDNSRPQGPKRQLRVSKKSSIRSRGAGLGHPMDPGVSVQNQNFTGNPEKLAKVRGTREETKSHYTDNSLEFGKACEDLSWNHCTSTPHRSETNGIAERAVRRVKEGTSAVLLQPGLNESWWADSVECEVYISRYRKSRQKWLRISGQQQEHHHDQCGQQWHHVHQQEWHEQSQREQPAQVSTAAHRALCFSSSSRVTPHSSLSLSSSSTCRTCVALSDLFDLLFPLPPVLHRPLLSLLPHALWLAHRPRQPGLRGK